MSGPVLGQLRCDACEWLSEPDLPLREHLDDVCPKCATKLVREQDIVALRVIEGFVEHGVVSPCRQDDKNRLVTIDTKGL